MDYKECFYKINKHLIKEGYESKLVTIDNIKVSVYAKMEQEFSSFKTQPLSSITKTQANIFIFITKVNQVSKEIVKRLSRKMWKYAINNYKGRIRGYNSGVMAINLFTSSSIEQDAINFVQSRPKIHWASFEMPVLFNLNNSSLYYYQNTPIWGGMHYKSLRQLIKKYFT